MARKSRKNIEVNAAAQAPLAPMVYSVGGYVRLSAEDKKKKGDSIENQQSIISAFIEEHDDLEFVEFYIDNGITGQTLERPAFQRMIADFESGKIDCCICKDLSRLGRNAIDTGFYVEKHFPINKIRCIAINDNYDSNDINSGGIMVSLKNMMNEAFALEIGRKIRQTKQMHIRNGNFVGRLAPYGYQKSKEDSHKLVIDEYAGKVVRQVFEMAADGKSVTDITEWLHANEILPPRLYNHTKKLLSQKESITQKYWSKLVIYDLLRNRVYAGDMVQGKTKTYSYNHQRIPESEWVVVENTHDPIVSRELFEKVQLLRHGSLDNSQNHKIYSANNENIFLRKVYCGHCGYAMSRAKSSKKKRRIICNTRHIYAKDVCVPVSIGETELKEKTMLEIIKKREEILVDNSYSVDSYLPAAYSGNEKDELLKVQSDIEKNNRFLKGLYESLIDGDITPDEYKELKAGYEKKSIALAEQERGLRNKTKKNSIERTTKLQSIKDFEMLKDAADLNAENIDKLIDKIFIFEDKHIEIVFKLTDGLKIEGGVECA